MKELKILVSKIVSKFLVKSEKSIRNLSKFSKFVGVLCKVLRYFTLFFDVDILVKGKGCTFSTIKEMVFWNEQKPWVFVL